MDLKALFAIAMVLISVISFVPLGLAQAGVPCVISGKVYRGDFSVEGLSVELQKSDGVRADISGNPYSTNERGEFIYSPGYGFGPGQIDCKDGTLYRIVILNCQGNSKCIKTAAISGGVIRGLLLDITGIPLDICPVVIPEGYIRSDQCPVTECTQCSTVPSCENQGYIKPEACPVIKEPVTETDLTTTVIVAIISVVVTLIATFKVGLKFYLKDSGEVAQLHKHNGIRGYHDWNILHKDARYRHRRFKDDPIGHFTDIKKIQIEGSL